MPSPLSVLIAATVLTMPTLAGGDTFLPTSEIVRVAKMAARDEGFIVKKTAGYYLNELRTPAGQEPIHGYASIGLLIGGTPIRSYAIRIQTGDVVETDRCEILRFSDLIKTKKQLMMDLRTHDVPLSQIASEVGCERLKVISRQRS